MADKRAQMYTDMDAPRNVLPSAPHYPDINVVDLPPSYEDTTTPTNMLVHTQQPIANQYQQPPMTTTTAAGNTVIYVQQQPYDEWMTTRRDWKQGFCECHRHCSGCLLAYFCGPFYACCVSSDVGQNCCCQLMQCLCYPLLLPCLRQDARHARSIKGNFLNDLIASWCCPCCTIVQIGREFNV